MREIEAVGKTIEKAIENGLKELNTTLENVDIKVLNEGGLFSKAKVLISLCEDEDNELIEEIADVAEKEEKKEKIDDQEAMDTVGEEVEEHTFFCCENGVCGLHSTKEKKEPVNKSEVSLDEVVSVATEFINGLCYILNLHTEIKADTEGKFPVLKLVGEDLGVLIGYRGETLSALQNLVNIVVHNKTGYFGKVIVDVENYRDKRNQTLCELATRISKQVVSNKRSFKLEPMNSYERRIIHSHLQNFEHITTHSEGVEPNRYLVIDYID